MGEVGWVQKPKSEMQVLLFHCNAEPDRVGQGMGVVKAWVLVRNARCTWHPAADGEGPLHWSDGGGGGGG